MLDVISKSEGQRSSEADVDRFRDGDRIGIRWQETGGPSVAPPTRKGFGSRVLESGLAHELSGTVDLDYRRDGLLCAIDSPAPRDARDE